jgi:hypothetical protein
MDDENVLQSILNDKSMKIIEILDGHHKMHKYIF